MSLPNDVNELLHHCRTLRLKKAPPTENTLLSAGCSGTWYFEWIENSYAKVSSHIGMEFYSPKPDGLPDNVTWIENTVGDMHRIASASIDTIFSGQNLEHIWTDELVGFFAESWRTLRTGGLLIIDSPNRLITERLNWSHPEHTVELTPDEAVKLAELAGFKVESVYGLWLMADDNGALLPFAPSGSLEALSHARIELAETRPDQSFIWWMEATKTSSPPDVGALEKFAKQVFTSAWPERMRRYVSNIDKRFPLNQQHDVRSQLGDDGALIFGPYMPLQAGTYSATFDISVAEPADTQVMIDVIAGNDVLDRKFISFGKRKPQRAHETIIFALNQMQFGMQARIFVDGKAPIVANFPVISAK